MTLFSSTKCLGRSAVRWVWDRLVLAKTSVTFTLVSVALVILREVEGLLELGVSGFEATLCMLQTCGDSFKVDSAGGSACQQERVACKLLQGHLTELKLTPKKVAAWEKKLAKTKRHQARKKAKRKESRR